MGMVRQHQCRAHGWSSRPLDHQTVEFGAKGRAGPSSSVAGQSDGRGGWVVKVVVASTPTLCCQGGCDRLLSWTKMVGGWEERK